MLSVTVVNFNSCISHQSRNAYSTWKKPRYLLNLNLNNKAKTLTFVSSRKCCSLCINSQRRKNVNNSSLSQQVIVFSAKNIYLSVRSKCTRCIRCAYTIQKRYGSQKRYWRKSIQEIVSSVQGKLLPIKLSVAGNYVKPRNKFSQVTPVNAKWNIAYFLKNVNNASNNRTTFDEDFNLEKNTGVSKDVNEIVVEDKTANISGEKIVPSAEHSIPLTCQNGETDINSDSVTENHECEDINNKKSTKTSVVTSDHIHSKTIVRRSQYEHLTTALANREEEKISYDSSIYDSVKSFVEVPMNTFFSFISRSNVLDKLSITKAEKSDNGESLSVSKSKIEDINPAKLNNPKQSPPPSLLETLYQYIPYVSSSPSENNPKKDPKISKKKKTDLEYKKEIRLKAEKELLLEKVNINNRTRYLIQEIISSNSLISLSQHVEDLKDHLLRFPDTRITAVNENAIKEIMHIYRTTYDKDLLPTLRMTLAMLGAVDPPKQRGIRVLSIDGGGSRGIASIEIFRQLTELSGRPINEMFDYICGVSTGAILSFLLGIKKLSIEELTPMYRELSSEIFNQNRLVGTGNLFVSHAYYDTENYQRVLKNIFGNLLLIETAAHEDIPKCSAVSTLVNRLPLKPFIWRNYSIVPGTRQTHWSGTCRATMWEAIRASSAAPGYFEEFKKGHNIHQDGGVLTNNPTGVALNECKLLWPNIPIQCVVSVGTGRYEPIVGPVGQDFSSLKDKLRKFVDSATSVTEVHAVMHNLLPAGTYFRFNPFIEEPLLLDECRTEKLDMLVENTCSYIERNDYKFRRCVSTLLGQ